MRSKKSNGKTRRANFRVNRNKPTEVSSELATDDGLDCSTLAEIQRKLIKKGKQNAVSRLFHAKSDKETITGWKSDLSKILLVFNVRSVVVA